MVFLFYYFCIFLSLLHMWFWLILLFTYCLSSAFIYIAIFFIRGIKITIIIRRWIFGKVSFIFLFFFFHSVFIALWPYFHFICAFVILCWSFLILSFLILDLFIHCYISFYLCWLLTVFISWFGFLVIWEWSRFFWSFCVHQSFQRINILRLRFLNYV